MADVIVTEGLTKVYPGEIRAVDGLDLRVREGEIFGLLGPNGAGKTTTGGMLTTGVVPTSGTVVVGGVDVIAHPALAKQAIGVVPQANTLDRSLDVWENLYFHGRYFGMSARAARGAADAALEQFRLTDRAKAPVLGLTFGTTFEPRTVPVMFGVILVPLTFLGCVYYSWDALEPIRWLQVVVLVNPLVYMAEGFRAALTDSPHMSLLAVYPALTGFTVVLTYLGIRGFTARVLS